MPVTLPAAARNPRMAGSRISFLSLAAPAYNEAGGIAGVVQAWLDYLRTSAEVERFEIVVCNDGSGDGTGAVLDELAGRNPEIVAVHHAQNRGAAAALSTAIDHTRGDWVLLIDSDGQFPIGNLPAMIEAVSQPGVEAAIGVRRAKHDGLFARFGSGASGAVCNWIYGTSYRDFNSAFKLVSGPLLRSLRLEAKGLNYSTEVTSRLAEHDVRLAEVEIEHAARRHGTSKMRLARGARDRLLFVLYLGLRHLLLRKQVLRKDHPCS